MDNSPFNKKKKSTIVFGDYERTEKEYGGHFNISVLLLLLEEDMLIRHDLGHSSCLVGQLSVPMATSQKDCVEEHFKDKATSSYAQDKDFLIDDLAIHGILVENLKRIEDDLLH